MNYFPGLGGLLNDLGDAISGVIDMDPRELEQLKKTLSDNAAALEDGEFQDIRLGETAFGGTDAASDLGKHHSLAHTIVADTILGVTEDLRTFRQGVIDFEKGMESADGFAAGDMSGLASLVDKTAFSHADAVNHESRSEHLSTDGADT